MKINKYTYLRVQGNESVEDRSSILEPNIDFIDDNSLIIREEQNNVSKYIKFDNITHYNDYVKLSKRKRYDHEVIFEWRKQKPHFDIDGGNAKLLEEIKEGISSVFDYLYNMEPVICDCDSSDETKFSHHLIVTNVCFENQNECKYFYNVLKTHLINAEMAIIDPGMMSKCHNLRLAGSYKGTRVKHIPHNYTFADTVVSNCKGIPVLPLVSEEKEYAPVDIKEVPKEEYLKQYLSVSDSQSK